MNSRKRKRLTHTIVFGMICAMMIVGAHIDSSASHAQATSNAKAAAHAG